MRILAAVDGSDASREASGFAADLASRCRSGRLTVVTAGDLDSRAWIPLSPAGHLATSIEESKRVWPERILQRERLAAERLGVPVRAAYLGMLRRGAVEETIAESIARAARRDRSELIVVGSGGAKQFARWLLGSVTLRLAHGCRRPVAVVRGGAALPRGAVRILVATDGSRPAREALRFAVRLASEVPRSRVVVLTVSTLAADIALTGPAVFRALGVLPDLARAEKEAADRILRDAAKRTRPLGKRARFVFLSPSRPEPAARAIVREAARRSADLIVLGNTGRSAFNDLVLGSVAQRVLDLSRRPVILVRSCPKRPARRA